MRESRVLIEALRERHGEALHDYDWYWELRISEVNSDELDNVGVFQLAVTETLVDESIVEITEPRVLVEQ